MSDPDHGVRLVPVDAANWRAVAALEVAPEQQDFVAEPSRYLALCAYDGLWTPLAIRAGDDVVGMLMWAVDPDEGAVWLGGILIDRRWQRRGIGRCAVRAATRLLARQEDMLEFALSYEPENDVARRTYAKLGFVETGETEDDEVVARLRLDAIPRRLRPERRPSEPRHLRSDSIRVKARPATAAALHDADDAEATPRGPNEVRRCARGWRRRPRRVAASRDRRRSRPCPGRGA